MSIKASCVSESEVTLCRLRTLACWHCSMCWELIFLAQETSTSDAILTAYPAVLWELFPGLQHLPISSKFSGSGGVIHQLYVNYSKENAEYFLSWSSCWWLEANKSQSKYIQSIHIAPHPAHLLFLYTGILLFIHVWFHPWSNIWCTFDSVVNLGGLWLDFQSSILIKAAKYFFLLDVKIKPNASIKFQRDFADKSTTDIANFEFRNEENASGNRTL